MSENKNTDVDTKKPKIKKVNDVWIFIYGWIASFLSVAIPLIMLAVIKKTYPSFSRANEEKITVIAYLIGAFFSGLFTIYRVYRKSIEKDDEIGELKRENDSLKKAYRAVLPKKRIITILTGILATPANSTIDEIKASIIKKLEEVNSDSFMDSTWEEMTYFLETHAEFNEFKQPVHSEKNKKNNAASPTNTYSFDNPPINFYGNNIR